MCLVHRFLLVCPPLDDFNECTFLFLFYLFLFCVDMVCFLERTCSTCHHKTQKSAFSNHRTQYRRIIPSIFIGTLTDTTADFIDSFTNVAQNFRGSWELLILQ